MQHTEKIPSLVCILSVCRQRYLTCLGIFNSNISSDPFREIFCLSVFIPFWIEYSTVYAEYFTDSNFWVFYRLQVQLSVAKLISPVSAYSSQTFHQTLFCWLNLFLPSVFIPFWIEYSTCLYCSSYSSQAFRHILFAKLNLSSFSFIPFWILQTPNLYCSSTVRLSPSFS